MPDGGQLVVRTYGTADGVALDLIDTGCGMDEKTQVADLRRLLLDQARRLGPGPAHDAEDHRGPRRPDHAAERSRPRHAVHDQAPAPARLDGGSRRVGPVKAQATASQMQRRRHAVFSRWITVLPRCRYACSTSPTPIACRNVVLTSRTGVRIRYHRRMATDAASNRRADQRTDPRADRRQRRSPRRGRGREPRAGRLPLPRGHLAAPKGLELIEEDAFDVVITDLVMNDIDGLGILATAEGGAARRRSDPDHRPRHDPSAVEAMQQGAFNYLLKPLDLEPASGGRPRRPPRARGCGGPTSN